MRSWMTRAAMMLMVLIGTALIAAGPFGGRIAAGTAARSAPSLSWAWKRDYKRGETLTYEMTGSNQNWQYRIQATDVVQREKSGAFYEEIGWSNLHSNVPMTLSPASLSFRQTLSMDGTGRHLAIPDLSKVQPLLIGPITDMLTFYSDLLLARHLGLTRAGQHVYFEHGKPNSWADGNYIVLGQDSIDFDLTLLRLDPHEHTVTVLARHVPPKRPQVRLPADWMKTPVADTPNNWVEVEKAGSKYTAQVGKETFDVRLVLDTRAGKLLSAHMDNTITSVRRTCDDAALSACGAPSPQTIHRTVSLRLVPDTVSGRNSSLEQTERRQVPGKGAQSLP